LGESQLHRDWLSGVVSFQDSLEMTIFPENEPGSNVWAPSTISLKLIVLVSLCCLPICALAQEQRLSQYAHRAWLVRDGFFGGAPNAITQTADGYIWVGTGSGIFRFDGARFEPWTSPDGTQFSSRQISALLGARDGSLWIGMGGGLAHFADGKLFVYPDFHDDVGFGSLLQDRDGKIWFGRSQSGGALRTPICQALPTTIRCLDRSDGLSLRSCCTQGLAQDTAGNLWIGTDGPLLRWKPGHSETYLAKGWTPINGLETASCVVALPDGSVLVCAVHPGAFGGFQRLSMGQWQPLTVPGFDGSKLRAASAFRDKDGGIWLGTMDAGLYRIHGNEFERFDSEDGLSGDFVYGFYQDREGGIWVATSGGVDYFHPRNVTTFSKREGLTSDGGDAVTAGSGNGVWLNEDSLDFLKNGQVHAIRTGHGLPGRTITAIFEDSFGKLWCGIDHDLYRYDGRKFDRVQGGGGGSTRFVVGITEDSGHDIWAEVSGHKHALIRVRGLRVIADYPDTIIPSARALAAGPNGALWLGLRDGDLARFHDGHTEVFPSPGGPKSYVYQVVVNPDGTVFATTSAGLVGWKDGTSRLLSSKNGLPCDSVIGAAWDNQDALWLDMGCGLARISKEDMDHWWRDQNAVVVPRVLDVSDGVRPGRPNFNPMVRTPDGRLWIATTSSLQMVDPGHLTRNNVLPPVQIEKIVGDRKAYQPNGDLVFPPLMRDLEIDYAALSFVNPQKVRYRYKLEGRDATWQEAGNRRLAFYTDLRPGSYRFHVIACNDDGLWNSEGAWVDFAIAPAWYQTDAFRVSSVLAAAFLLWLLYYRRMRQASRSIRARFEERVEERTRLARDLHDTLLQTLQGSKLAADDALEHRSDAEYTSRSLERLSQWIDRAIREGRAALNALHTGEFDNRELSERLQSALDERELNGVAERSVTISGSPVAIDPMIADEICKVGYEAIRNSFVHSQASRIEVQLSYSQDFTLIVRDNGRGMDSATASKGKEGHFGLQSMRQRAARIHAQFQLITAPHLGTTIELKVSGKTAFGRDPRAWSRLWSWTRGTRRFEA
jgi:signal transduction histidine kinase/ligand-binding sensor domain-containing protein